MADFDIANLTDAGSKRGNEPNQDSVLVLPAEDDRGLMPLIVVADGMGGHVGGAVASRMVVEAIAARYRQSHPGDDPLVLLGDCLQYALEASVCMPGRIRNWLRWGARSCWRSWETGMPR